MKIFLIVSTDVECDKGSQWEIKRPISFKNVVEGIPERVDPLFDEFHIRATYLISPEVLADRQSIRFLQSIQDKAELGTHMHSEFMGPHPNWDANRTDSFHGDFAPQIEFQKIRNLTKLFTSEFGFKPTSFRAGRFGLSRYTLRFLEKLGYKVDSSVTPYLWWWRRGGKGINFLGAPNQPYFPSLEDFRKKGRMRILEVPVSVVNPFWENFPSYFLRKMNPLSRTQIILLNTFFRNKLRSLWLRPTFSSADQMLFVTNWIIKNANARTPVINMMFHSNEATPGTSPYNSTEGDVDNFLDRIRKYFEMLFSRYDVNSIGLSDTKNLIEFRWNLIIK